METLWMIEPWHWLVLGFVLLIVEMFVPTFASLWFGAAAIIVAALTWLLPIGFSLQIVIWLVLSAVFWWYGSSLLNLYRWIVLRQGLAVV